MFAVWMRLLGAVENSVLWLPRIEHCRGTATFAAKPKSQRVRTKTLFAPLVSADEDHLARLSLADLFLVSPYNARSTAIDALPGRRAHADDSGDAGSAGRIASSTLVADGPSRADFRFDQGL